mgnify:CR=1 FL=1
MRLVALGLTNYAIGWRLRISKNTVRNHLTNIFEKIHAGSRQEAAVAYVREEIAAGGR